MPRVRFPACSWFTSSRISRLERHGRRHTETQSLTVTTSAPRTAMGAGLTISPGPRLSRLDRWSSPAGFSGVELMAVVAIIGLMVLVTAPAMLNFYAAMKVRTASHRLMSHLRLCRQVSVSHRTDVLMELQANNGTTTPEYKAWEEKGGNMTRTAAGADGVPGTEDDENWVIPRENQLAIDKVIFLDAYDDTSPSTPEPPGTSVLDSDKKLLLRFSSNGRVARLDTSDGSSEPYTMLRMRLQKRLNSSRMDTWDATLYPLGKVGSDFTHGP